MILDQFGLENQVAIVTGGSGLYGSLIAGALAEAGAQVVVTSRDEQKAQATAATLTGSGHFGVMLDLANHASIANFTEIVHKRCGPIDILVNNAVHRQGGDLFQASPKDWQATSRVNSEGTFFLTQSIVHSMSKRGKGSVIFISSIYGLVAPDFAIYGDTGMTSPAFYSYDKAGMVGLTRYLASALGPQGVRVNCLCPGGLYVDQDPDFVREYAARTPLGRMAEPGDVEAAVVFLASDASRYITGVVLPIDGGWTAR